MHYFSHRESHRQAKATGVSCVLTFPNLIYLCFTLYLTVLLSWTVDWSMPSFLTPSVLVAPLGTFNLRITDLEPLHHWLMGVEMVDRLLRGMSLVSLSMGETRFLSLLPAGTFLHMCHSIRHLKSPFLQKSSTELKFLLQFMGWWVGGLGEKEMQPCRQQDSR